LEGCEIETSVSTIAFDVQREPKCLLKICVLSTSNFRSTL